LPMRMTDALINAANEFGEKANLRLTQAQDLVTDAQDGVSRAQQWLQDKKEDVDKANNKFDEAVNALDNAVAEIDSLQDDVQSAKDWLREKRLDIDNLCQMRNCHKICIPFIKCRWRHTRILRIPYPSCYLSRCGIKITDPLCIAANIICAAIRAVAYVALGMAELAVGVALTALDVAKTAVYTVQFVVDRARIILDLAKLALDLVTVTLEGVKLVFETAKYALELVKLAVAAGIEVFNFIVRHGLGSVVDIQRIWFEVEVSTVDVFVFEVGIEVDLFRIGMRTVKVVINFRNLAESIWNVAVSVIELLADMLTPFKKKRAIEYVDQPYNSSEHVNQTLHVETFESEYMNASWVTEGNENDFRVSLFKKKCDTFLNIYDFLFQSIFLLNEIADESKNSRDNSSEELDDFSMFQNNITLIDVDRSSVNVTEAYVNYNITEEDIEAEIYKLNLTENPAIRESLAVMNETHASSLRSLELAAGYQIVGPWKAGMENFTHEMFTEEECASFEDCLLITFDKFYRLYEHVDLPYVNSMKNLILESKAQFYGILRNDSLRLDDALDISSSLLNVLQKTLNLKIFCAEQPIILNELVNMTLVENEEIVLFCNATGDPTPTITWYNDDNLIF
ncbi:uncharacterized protein LOC144359092, partial [Saccoglossus kowalevskii]